MSTLPNISKSRGVSMIEVLVTIVILAFGLLGVAGIQTRLQASETEAYQRSQALILLQDMANRIEVNRAFATNYITGTTTPLGMGGQCPAVPADATRDLIDLGEWCNALQGAAEMDADMTRRGSMIGARGCVERLTNGDFMITVAWQGLGPVSAPPQSVACGANQYDGGAGSPCVNDLCRRAITTIVRIANLI